MICCVTSSVLSQRNTPTTLRDKWCIADDKLSFLDFIQTLIAQMTQLFIVCFRLIYYFQVFLFPLLFVACMHYEHYVLVLVELIRLDGLID